jgi:hypothetical protein
LNDPTQWKSSGKTRKTVPTNTDKPSTSNSVGNNNKLNVVTNNNKTCEKKSSQTTNNPNTHTLDYNLIEDMKKTKDGISMFDIFSLPQQCEILNDAFKPDDAQKNMVTDTDNTFSEDEVHVIHKL